jgi:hypothetical protein
MGDHEGNAAECVDQHDGNGTVLEIGEEQDVAEPREEEKSDDTEGIVDAEGIPHAAGERDNEELAEDEDDREAPKAMVALECYIDASDEAVDEEERKRADEGGRFDSSGCGRLH